MRWFMKNCSPKTPVLRRKKKQHCTSYNIIETVKFIRLALTTTNIFIFTESKTFQYMCLFQFYIGGVPEKQDGLVVVQNFTGCMENVYINSTNLIEQIKYAYDNEDYFLMAKYRKLHTTYSCPVS